MTPKQPRRLRRRSRQMEKLEAREFFTCSPLGFDYTHTFRINGEEGTAFASGSFDPETGGLEYTATTTNYVDGYRPWPASPWTLAVTSGAPICSLEVGPAKNIFNVVDGVLDYEVTVHTSDEFADIETEISVSLVDDTVVAELISTGVADYPFLTGMEGPMVFRQTPSQDGFTESGIKRLVTEDGSIIESTLTAEFHGIEIENPQTREVSLEVLHVTSDFLEGSIRLTSVVSGDETLQPLPVYSDLSTTGDMIERIDGGLIGQEPINDSIQQLIDDTTRSHSNPVANGSGFVISPIVGSTLLTGLRIYPTDASPGNDPASFLVEGEISPGEYAVIAEGDLELPQKRNVNDGSVIGTNNSYQEIHFDNESAFDSYRITFPRLRSGDAESLEIAEIELLGDVVTNDGLVADIDLDGSVGFTDFLVLSQNFGSSVESGTSGDLDFDGQVSFQDFLILSRDFGKSATMAIGFEEALLNDANLIADANDWSADETLQLLQHQDTAGELAAQIADVYPTVFAGAILAGEPGAASVIRFKGTTPEAAMDLILSSSVPVQVEDGMPFSSLELRDMTVQAVEILAANGFEEVGGTVTGDGTIDVVVRGDGDIVLPDELQEVVDVIVHDEPVLKLGRTRGGARVIGEGGCTSGFNVRQLYHGATGVTTAGHCGSINTYIPPSGAPSYSLSQQNVHVGGLGDIQWMTSPHVEPAEYFASENEVRQVTDVDTGSEISVNRWYCGYGRTSNVRKCDQVSSTFVIFFTFETGFIGDLVSMKNSFTQPGDSGGPWSWGTTAVGTTVGSHWWFGNHDVFSRADKFPQAVGVEVATTSTSVPQAIFDPANLLSSQYRPGQGWRVDQHPRRLGDVDGDGRDDVVGFGSSGVWLALSTGNGFDGPNLVLQDFQPNQGWRVDQHPRMLGDVNGDGMSDIIGFGSSGVWLSTSTGTGFTNPTLVLQDFRPNQGWRVDRHPRMMADVNGDGRDDIIGFGSAGVWLSTSTGTGFTNPTLVLQDFRLNQGWRVDQHPRMLADVNGDGRDDIIGFGSSGVWISTSTGSGFNSPQLALRSYRPSEGWRVDQHPRLASDVTGDGRADIVGFGSAGVWLAISNGNGFETPRLASQDFRPGQGWRVEQHPRLLADVDGDGKSDIVGFGNSGVWVAKAGTVI